MGLNCVWRDMLQVCLVFISLTTSLSISCHILIDYAAVDATSISFKQELEGFRDQNRSAGFISIY